MAPGTDAGSPADSCELGLARCAGVSHDAPRMLRIFPSDVVTFIEKHYPNLAATIRLDYSHLSSIAAIAAAVDGIPSELIRLASNDAVVFVTAVAQLEAAVTIWSAGGREGRGHSIKGSKESPNPILVIREKLAKCPDEVAAEDTPELPFITDPELRQDLRLDLSAMAHAERAGQWKVATVMAGAVLEAILLDGLEKAGAGTKKRPLVKLNLKEYVEKAKEHGIIEENTGVVADLARDYRNLIHPGKAKRQQTKVTRAIATVAIAAVYKAIEDIVTGTSKLDMINETGFHPSAGTKLD